MSAAIVTRDPLSLGAEDEAAESPGSLAAADAAITCTCYLLHA